MIRLPLATALAAALALAPALANAQADEAEELPEAAARRWHLVEPLGGAPSPWIALAGAVDGGATVDGEAGWSAVRVHVPVARHYGAVDARLLATFDDEGLDTLGPEIVLRGVPLRFSEGRGALGFSLTFVPGIRELEPTIDLGGGLMGGWLGRRWFAWSHVGVRAEVLQRSRPELRATLGTGLRLPHGLRPQLEAELRWELHPQGDPAFALRPGFRYWPSEWIGIGVSADIWIVGPGIETTAIRLDVVGHPLE